MNRSEKSYTNYGYGSSGSGGEETLSRYQASLADIVVRSLLLIGWLIAYTISEPHMLINSWRKSPIFSKAISFSRRFSTVLTNFRLHSTSRKWEPSKGRTYSRVNPKEQSAKLFRFQADCYSWEIGIMIRTWLLAIG